MGKKYGRKVGEDPMEEAGNSGVSASSGEKAERIKSDGNGNLGEDGKGIVQAERNDSENSESDEGGGPIQKKKGSRVLLWVVIAVAAAVLVFALANIIGIKSEDIASEKTYQDLKQIAQSSTGVSDQENPLDRKIDFDALHAVNDQIIAWIYIPNTRIDYPVVAGEDNDYYISHGANKEENRAGAIFLEYRNKPDFTDRNTIIYGHRMNDGSMFAELHKFEDEAFLRNNDKIYLYLPDGTVNEYDIFGADIVSDMDEAYTFGFANDEEYVSYLNKMKNRSAASVDMEFEADDQIITLSTCVRGQDEKRYIVQAVLKH